MKYLIYEVWTKHQIIDAKSESDAYWVHTPKPVKGLDLCNWHVIKLPKETK